MFGAFPLRDWLLALAPLAIIAYFVYNPDRLQAVADLMSALIP